jgi:hypothetical protein
LSVMSEEYEGRPLVTSEIAERCNLVL